MHPANKYILSEYQDLGALDTNDNIHLLRNKISGIICVRKIVSVESISIYRFLKEHPSPYIPQIFESIIDGDQLIVIEEYLTGQNLEDFLHSSSFTEEQAVKIIINLCHALSPLHNAKPQIICRDLKAENVMITTSNEVKLVDFDIARTFQKGQKRDTQLMGTEAYAAPEQFGFRQTDGRTDIYALGILLNYLVTGQFPIDKLADGALKQIILHCTALDPKDRYQNVIDLETALRQLNYNIPPLSYPSMKTERPHSSSYIIPGFRSHNLWKMITAVLGYIFITWFCFSIEFIQNEVPIDIKFQMINRTVIWISQLIFISIVCNYRNCQESLPILKKLKKPVRILLYILIDLLLIILGAFICVLLEDIFS